MVFSGKAEQISKSASVHLGTVLASVAARNKTPAFPPNDLNPVDWGRVYWDHSSLAMKSRQFDLMKLEHWTVKNDDYSLMPFR